MEAFSKRKQGRISQWGAGPRRDTCLQGTSLGRQQRPAKGVGHCETPRTSEQVPWGRMLQQQLVLLKWTIPSEDSPTSGSQHQEITCCGGNVFSLYANWETGGEKEFRISQNNRGMLTPPRRGYSQGQDRGTHSVLPNTIFLVHPSSDVFHAHAPTRAQRILAAAKHELPSRSGR